MLLIAILYFLVITATSVFLLAIQTTFIDIKSIFYIVSTALVFTYGITSSQVIKQAFSIVFENKKDLTTNDYKSAKLVFIIFGNASFLLSITMFLVDLVALLSIQNSIDSLRFNIPVLLLSLIYGVILKITCYALEMKISMLQIQN